MAAPRGSSTHRNRNWSTYGLLIMSTPYGRWYWDEKLRDINFVPSLKMNPTESANLRPAQNTLPGALRLAARIMQDICLREEKEDGN